MPLEIRNCHRARGKRALACWTTCPTPSIVLDTGPPCKCSQSREFFCQVTDPTQSRGNSSTPNRSLFKAGCELLKTWGLTNPALAETIETLHPRSMWACGAAGSALPWHGRGHRFDPDQVHQLNQQFSSIPLFPLGSKLAANFKTFLAEGSEVAFPPFPVARSRSRVLPVVFTRSLWFGCCLAEIEERVPDAADCRPLVPVPINSR